MRVLMFLHEIIMDPWCIWHADSNVILIVNFWTLWDFLEKIGWRSSWSSSCSSYVHTLSRLPANFVVERIRLPADFVTCSCILPADYLNAMHARARVWADTVSFQPWRASVQIVTQFDSQLQQIFKCFLMLCHFPPISILCFTWLFLFFL